jgi:hypothetical protein
LLAQILTACVTGGGHPDEAVSVPALVQPQFQPCAPADGAVVLQAYEGETMLGSLEVEWIAKPGGDWEVEATNAVGLTMLKLSRKARVITVGGQLKDRLPKISVSKGGYLMLDDERVGLKASELPCLLGFRAPRPWLDNVMAVDNDEEDKTVLKVADPIRDITVTTRGMGGKGTGSVCSRLVWTRYMVIHPEILWCRTLAARPEATLKGMDDYMLKWVPLDER